MRRAETHPGVAVIREIDRPAAEQAEEEVE
jgi:hypothetical protein